jgi:hypothetical protein
VAAILLGLGGVIAATRIHPAQSAAARADPWCQRLTLHPPQQCEGTLTIAAPLMRGSYSVDVIFPGEAPPLDFGMAYHEVRKHARVTLSAASQAAPLPSHGDSLISGPAEDQLDWRHGVELCGFRAHSTGAVTISCHLDEGPPWPAEVSIGISHSDRAATSPPPMMTKKTAGARAFAFPALLVLAGAGMCWRATRRA